MGEVLEFRRKSSNDGASTGDGSGYESGLAPQERTALSITRTIFTEARDVAVPRAGGLEVHPGMLDLDSGQWSAERLTHVQLDTAPDEA